MDDQAWTTSIGSRYDVSKCTETFVILLQSITNRFKHLNDECQLKFVELQSDLLEDMRLRFAQVVRQEQTFPLTEKYCLILNLSYYIYYEVKSRSKLYKDIKWFSYSRIVETDP